MVGWHHQLDRHEFEQTLGDGKGQRNLVCCRPRGHKESDRAERLNNNNKIRTDNPIPWGCSTFRDGPHSVWNVCYAMLSHFSRVQLCVTP